MRTEQHTKRFLYVEEKAEIREEVSRFLMELGFRVVAVESDVQALQEIASNSFDMVLINAMRPKASGLYGDEVLKIIRSFHNELALPVFFLTEPLSEEKVVTLYRLGATEHLTLPLSYPILLEKIKSAFRLRALAHSAIDYTRTRQVDLPQTGETFAQKYKLQKKIGEGSFGDVFSAVDKESGDNVAIKIIRSKMLLEGEDESSFEREFEATTKIQHPNAVRVYDYGFSDSGFPYLSMELLQGKNLSEVLDKKRRISYDKVLKLMLPICSVLSKAHGIGLIHRDIKTENIFIHQQNRSEVVKLLDFGIARVVEQQRINQNLTMEEVEFGTPAYMAPERFRNFPYDSKIDVYSLGVVFYEVLCGKLPFVPKEQSAVAMAMLHLRETPVPPREVFSEIPEEVSQLVMHCMQKNPTQRPGIDMIAQEIAYILGIEIDMYTYLLPGQMYVHSSFYEDLAKSFRKIQA